MLLGFECDYSIEGSETLLISNLGTSTYSLPLFRSLEHLLWMGQKNLSVWWYVK